ncbi:glutamate--tRNA ligase [Pyruvatibacter sp.]|uniref:glutamate--tRNA ligase n=1 Tax=Pyruvatibacter sp. TaxID=1981328 RepID=UPI0032EF15E3
MTASPPADAKTPVTNGKGKVRTRFAPSPTGFLHIGGARTALFNWLYARHCGGDFLLRIEDTDRTRSTQGAVEAIFDGLRWLGLDWDEEPTFQYARRDRHAEVANELVAKGKAYKCYASPEDLAQMREDAKASGKPQGYDGRWRDRDPAEAPAGVPPVIRLKMPLDGETTIHDHVQGDVTIPNAVMDDFILLRSDGSPTYMLSVVVDDHDMDITHVIRGDDHLTNAARQINLITAMGWDVPEYAHVPMIHGPDGAKLSKRHGALGAEAYRDMGYLPEAMRNYLARLGWSHGDDEIFSTDQAIEWFGLEQIGKSPARFDFAKLANLNGTYVREADDTRLADETLRMMTQVKGWTVSDATRDALVQAMPGLKERAKTLDDLAEGARFLIEQRPLPIDEKAAKLLDDQARGILTGIVPALESLPAWTMDGIETTIRDFAEAQDVKLGKVAQPLRAALTGTTTSPGIFDVLAVLGKDESLARIKDQAA